MVPVEVIPSGYAGLLRDFEGGLIFARAGAIMPPKSTWFEPKLRSGLLVHTFDAK